MTEMLLGNAMVMIMYQINTLYKLNLLKVACQFYLNKKSKNFKSLKFSNCQLEELSYWATEGSRPGVGIEK